MKNLYKYRFLILLGALMLMSSAFQSEESKLKETGITALNKCSSLYLNLNNFSMDVEYSIFYNPVNFDKPADSDMGSIIRKGQNFYKKEFGNISIINKQYQLIVDEGSKVLFIVNRSKEDVIPKQIETDSLTSYISKVEKLEGGYSYHFKYGEIAKMDVLYTKDGYMHTLRQYYREKIDFGDGFVHVVSQIRYLNFKINPETKASLFSEKKYISILKSGEIVLKEKYSNYRVINKINTP